MKKRITQILAAIVVATTTALTANAQDDLDVIGYAKVNITLQAATPGSGKVFASNKEVGLKGWRETYNYNNAATIGNLVDVPLACFFIYARPESSYMFVGWYLDDGDGVFDIDKDEFLGDEETYYHMSVLSDDTEVYATEVEAKNGVGPSEPTELIWAYFTRGARVGMSHYQDDMYDHFANCGSVWVNKPVNEPGDELVIEALPNDGYHFVYWQDAYEIGNIVSRENPYRFTVKGGERLYAYFEADDAPKVTLPEEGGFAVITADHYWFLSDESILNGAHVLVMTADDLRRDADGRTYLDMNIEDSHMEVAQVEEPTIIYGKGEVRFSIHLKNFGFIRSHNDLVKWSGNKGVDCSGDVIYVYVFVPQLGAFLQYGTTDEFNPNHSSVVHVPDHLAYFQMSAFDLTDDDGNIPTVIGFSPETFDQGMSHFSEGMNIISGIEGVKTSQRTIKDKTFYTLSGVPVQTLPDQGIVIVGGKKYRIK